MFARGACTLHSIIMHRAHGVGEGEGRRAARNARGEKWLEKVEYSSMHI